MEHSSEVPNFLLVLDLDIQIPHRNRYMQGYTILKRGVAFSTCQGHDYMKLVRKVPYSSGIRTTARIM